MTKFAGCVFLMGLLLSSTALAGPLLNHANAWTDPNNRTWTGSTNFVDGSGELEADIEWSVFGPGDCPYSGANFTPTPGEYVYTYQVITQPTLDVRKFWVNMKAGNQANGIGWFDLPGGLDPVAANFGSSDPQNLVSADWTFGGDLLPGQVSVGLGYSSINAPIDWFGFIQDGGHPGQPQNTLPSPGDLIPEPITVAILLLAGIGLMALRRRK